MTVLVAFTSRVHGVSFLGSDDLEHHAQKRCDKVIAVFARFLIGGLAADVVHHTARVVPALGAEPTVLRDFSAYRAPESIEEYCNMVCSVLPLVAEQYEYGLNQAVVRGERTPEQQRLFETTRGALVLLDIAERRLVLADFGPPLPARLSYQYAPLEFAPERCLRFGVNDPHDLGPIPREALKKPFHWCSGHVHDARKLVEAAGHGGAIGELGACYFAKGGRLRARTSFESLLDAARFFYPPLPGQGAEPREQT